jgi:uncharacterized delta-60 repeat protein
MKYFSRKTRHLRENFLFGFLAIGLFLVLPALTFAAPGDLDLSFGNGGKVVTRGNSNYPGFGLSGAYAMAIQSDGKIVVAGEGTAGSGTWDFAVVRFNTNGSFDTSFGGTGIVITPVGNSQDRAFSVAIQADGKIVAAGYSYNDGIIGISFGVVRYNPNGSLDTSFNGTGKVITSFGSSSAIANDLAIQADGKIVVAGGAYGGSTGYVPAVVRYNSNGSLDTSFNGTGIIITPLTNSSVAIQTDGKVVVAGSGYSGSRIDFTIFRYNTDGSPDTSFNGTGKTVTQIGDSSYANELAIQTDGKIIVVGRSRNGSRDNFALVRYNTNGSLDTSLNGTGKVLTPVGTTSYGSGASTVAIQPDGKIVAAGDSGNGTLFEQGADFAVIRYNPNGSLDTTFNGTGKVITRFGGQDFVSEIAIQADGKIVVAGSTDFDAYDFYQFVVVRYEGGSNANIRTRFDFDGDGRADISVFRPSDGFWYLNQSTNGLSATQFGLSTDKITPADYDGDGRTDIAVWRETTPTHAYFYILESKTNTFRFEQFGTTGDIPVSADFDSDGKADVAVYRNGASAGAQSFFFYRPSAAPGVDFRTIYWGAAGNKPVVGDYDGDGKADAAVFDPSTGIWYVLRSLDNQLYAIHFGSSTDKLVPADYDGDGKTDVAVFRPDDGTWYLNRSRDGFTGAQFGFGTDKPVPADYDGDGRTDIAVFRDGTWYLNRSRDGFTGVTFGNPTDKPVPNAFVP